MIHPQKQWFSVFLGLFAGYLCEVRRWILVKWFPLLIPFPKWVIQDGVSYWKMLVNWHDSFYKSWLFWSLKHDPDISPKCDVTKHHWFPGKVNSWTGAFPEMPGAIRSASGIVLLTPILPSASDAARVVSWNVLLVPARYLLLEVRSSKDFSSPHVRRFNDRFRFRLPFWKMRWNVLICDKLWQWSENMIM